MSFSPVTCSSVSRESCLRRESVASYLPMYHSCCRGHSSQSWTHIKCSKYVLSSKLVSECLYSIFLDCIYLFLERGDRRKKEGERNINVWLPLTHPLLGTWPAIQACTLTGNQTGDPLVRRPALSPLSHTSQGPFWLDRKRILSNISKSQAGWAT